MQNTCSYIFWQTSCGRADLGKVDELQRTWWNGPYEGHSCKGIKFQPASGAGI